MKLKFIEVFEFERMPLREKFWREHLKIPNLDYSAVAFADFVMPKPGANMSFQRSNPQDSENAKAAKKSEALSQEKVGIIFDTFPSEDLYAQIKEAPLEVLEVQTFDSLFYENNGIIPRILTTQAVHDVLALRKPKLSNQDVAYVTGAHRLAMATAAMLVRMGFHEVHWVVPDKGLIERELKDLALRYFGARFIALNDSDLTLQPNDGSILVNFYTTQENANAIDDLAYLNFLRHEGVVVDVPFSVTPNNLCDEAKNSDVSTVDSVEVAGVRDFLFLKHFNLVSISLLEYLTQWRDFVLVEQPVSTPD